MAGTMSPALLDLIALRFSVLSEPARLRILTELMECEEMTVTEISERTGLNQANLSKHLRLLRASEYVTRRKEGLYAYYRLSDPSVHDLCSIMCRRLEQEVDVKAELLGAGT